ncbi:CotO family spore coat protein [Heyndrickxia vini]|uniref:Spore coat protein CotO n=1 Tax=Heyndrickxia vini TaxID=1476025 RepID=A0ABX7DXX5_9BACI|nr:CotO family spore coat protein [Heyndrickxia vini]QQZ08181.1 hypothetical protein I5776_13980 [Heyndrickxia vini]
MSTSKDHYEKRKPLLYIIQPESKAVSVNMQTTFSSKFSTKESELMEEAAPPSNEDDNEVNNDFVEGNHSSNEINNALVNEEDNSNEINSKLVNEDGKIQSEQIDDTQNVVLENGKTMHTIIRNSPQQKTGYRRRSFKEMDVPEKVNFLVNKPGYIPQVIVEIQTEASNYTGIVVNYSDGIVVFDQLKMGQHPLKLNEAEIKDIKIVSN